MIHYCLTNKESITLETREAFSYGFKKVEDLSLGNEILSKNAKILRQYFESHRP